MSRSSLIRWGGLAYGLGGVSLIVQQLYAWFGVVAVFSRPVFAVAVAVFGLGNAWLGYAVWSGAGEMAGQPQPTQAR